MKINTPLITMLTVLFGAVIFINSCSKDEPQQKVEIPKLTTSTVVSINGTSAVSGGNINSNGGSPITLRGLCWSIKPNPTTSDFNTQDGVGNGAFISSMSGLTPETVYYVRAYATNRVGTGYGNEIIFVTLSLPVLTTTPLSLIDGISATSGGNISSDGGTSISTRGVCWNTQPGPTINNSKTQNGTGTGEFISNISGLSPVTTYYLRAYATNSAGTSYGKELSFTTDHWVSTFTGNTSGSKDGDLTTAQFNYPSDIAIDKVGTIYVADFANNKIRKITTTGTVSTLAGGTNTGPGFLDGAGASAQFERPNGIAVDAGGNVYVADRYNNRIRKITPAGMVSSLAGSFVEGFADGRGSAANFNRPNGVDVDAKGNVYVADTYNNRIRKITPDGDVTTLAGTGAFGFKDGDATTAQFNLPYGLEVDSDGNVYVADYNNQRIRKITPGGVVSTIAGSGVKGYLNSNSIATQFNYPSSVARDSKGNLYVADSGNNIIRKITPEGMVSTYAGISEPAFLDGKLTTARFNNPFGVAVDAFDRVYVADQSNHRIRKIE